MRLGEGEILLPEGIDFYEGAVFLDEELPHTLTCICKKTGKVTTGILSTINLNALSRGDYNYENTCPAKQVNGYCRVLGGDKCEI